MTRRLTLLIALAGCGGSTKRWDNQIETPRATLADVGAPHVPVVVQTSGGLSRLYLDTGSREPVGGSDSAIPLGASALLDIVGGQYVVTRSGADKIVLENVTPTSYQAVAPDYKHLAVIEDQAIVVAELTTGAVRRHATPTRARNFRFESNDSLLVLLEQPSRLDIATGALTPAESVTEYEMLSRRSPKLECPTKGFALEQRTQKSRQEIVVLPTASTADPENLASLDTRVLVQATDKSGRSGDGAINLGKKNPEPLSLDALLPSCEHFVFSLEGKTYVGNIATGAIAFVGHGWGASL